VLVTTSRLLSTGIDVQTCKLIVIDKNIESMGEFKQIIGRGTRVREDANKYFFTILDFRGASHHFADPDFDGPPIEVYVQPVDGPMVPPEDAELPEPEPGEIVVSEPPPYYSAEKDNSGRSKIYINGVPAQIIAERIEYLDHEGKLVTETLRDYSKRTIVEHFVSLDSFLQRWSSSDRKQAIVEELSAECIPLDLLADEVGKDLDPFDLVCHVAFDQPALTRKERADNVRKRDVFAKYGTQARAVLEALLRKYQDDGGVDLGDVRILQIPPLDQMGTLVQLINGFGSRGDFEHAVHDMQAALYEVA
jgi:type I restriction enzyme R subunit